jgi:hypothetical protein
VDIDQFSKFFITISPDIGTAPGRGQQIKSFFPYPDSMGDYT